MQIAPTRLVILRREPIVRTCSKTIHMTSLPIFADLEAIAPKSVAHVRCLEHTIEAHGADLLVVSARKYRAGHARNGVPEKRLRGIGG